MRRTILTFAATLTILGTAGCADQAPPEAAVTPTPTHIVSPSPTPTPTPTPDLFPFEVDDRGVPVIWDVPVPEAEIAEAVVQIDSYDDVRAVLLRPRDAPSNDVTRAWLDAAGADFGKAPTVFEDDGVLRGEVDDAEGTNYEHLVIATDRLEGFQFELVTRAYWENALNDAVPESRELPADFDAPLPQGDGFSVLNWWKTYSTATSDVTTVASLSGVNAEDRPQLKEWPASLEEWELVDEREGETWYYATLTRGDGAELAFSLPMDLHQGPEVRFTP
ncbi:hypothetical protein [Microbacterium suaedae]|uniref:hypothetical protein n=1 Tax=Microbacterium suaedae TaxID=2067813 RepID=UPI000DA22D81|nr:hypothetical protein [Microbacterium suaedae]